MSNELELVIETLGGLGDGIARSDAGPIFVSGALPGDRLKVKLGEKRGRGRIGRIVENLDPAERLEPPCQHFETCGGCIAQHMPAETYRNWKLDKLKQALRSRAIEMPEMAPPFFAAPEMRRRLTLHGRRTKDRLLLGYMQSGSKRLINLLQCPVAEPGITKMFDPIRQLLAELQSHRSFHVHVLHCDNGLDIWLRGEGDLSLQDREVCVAFAQAHDLCRLSWGKDAEPVIIQREPIIRFGSVAVSPFPGGFLQATAASQNLMIDTLRAELADAHKIADLFAGIGTFSFPLCEFAAVDGFERAGEAVNAFISARNRQAPRHPVTCFERDLARVPLTSAELSAYDAVVIDPPKSGAKEQAEELSQSSVPKIVSISCNPGTFARDARILLDGGYQLEKLWMIDQFLWSTELEVMGLFTRFNS